MNLSLATSAYGQVTGPVRTPRSLEYEALTRTTRGLAEASLRREADFPALARALNDNLRLWTVLASDVAEPANGLPSALKARLFYLYEFTARHSRAVRDGTGSVEVLIDINTAVMRGLRGEGAAA